MKENKKKMKMTKLINMPTTKKFIFVLAKPRERTEKEIFESNLLMAERCYTIKQLPTQENPEIALRYILNHKEIFKTQLKPITWSHWELNEKELFLFRRMEEVFFSFYCLLPF